MIETIIHWIVAFVEALGYPGVFLMSALESTFMPIPSEATLIPAGYLIHQGKMDGPLVFFLAITGTMTGSLVNYYLAKYCGRYVLVKYGKYFFFTEDKMQKVESYFYSHGPISIFLGRLILGVRHFISFPAGLANMNLTKFCLYTAIGGGLWTAILLVLGYQLGNNQELVKSLIPEIKIGCFIAVIVVAGIYIWRHKRKLAAKIPL